MAKCTPAGLETLMRPLASALYPKEAPGTGICCMVMVRLAQVLTDLSMYGMMQLVVLP